MLEDLSSFYKKSLLGFFLLLISLYPVFSLLGPFFENLNLILLGSISILYIIKNKIFLKLIDLPFALFFLVVLINSLTAENISDTVKSLKYILYFFLLIFCIKVKFEKSYFQLLNKVFVIIVFTLSVLCIDMIIQKLVGFNIIGFKALECFYDSIIIEKCRVSGFFGEEYVAGSFISRIALILSIYYLLIEKKFLILIFVLILSLISIYLSGERISLFFFLQVLFIAIAYIFISERKKINLIKLISFAVIFYLSFIFLINQNTIIRFTKGLSLLYDKDYFRINISEKKLKNIDYLKINEEFIEKEFQLVPNEVYGFYRNKVDIKDSLYGDTSNLTPRYINDLNSVPIFLSETNFKIDTKKLNNDESYVQIVSTQKVHKHFFNSTGWSAHFIAALKIFEKNIFLGTGYKSFFEECKKLGKINHIYNSHKCSIHPHNFHLEILQSSGLIGYLCFLILIYSILMTIIKNKNLGILDKSLLILFIIVIFQPITTSGSIFSSSFSNKLWLITSITILLSRFKSYKNEFNN